MLNLRHHIIKTMQQQQHILQVDELTSHCITDSKSLDPAIVSPRTDIHTEIHTNAHTLIHRYVERERERERGRELPRINFA
jgi:hypothetical protein